MAASRLRGPWCPIRNPTIIDTGTMVRGVSPPPGPLGAGTTPVSTGAASREADGADALGKVYIATNPESLAGEAVGSGQCVEFVKKASGAPQTSKWKRGPKVRANKSIQAGTAIATFDANGRYGNHTGGRSHAAIYIGQDTEGLDVWDQYTGTPVHRRSIKFRGGAVEVKPVNDGDAYYVIQ